MEEEDCEFTQKRSLGKYVVEDAQFCYRIQIILQTKTFPKIRPR